MKAKATFLICLMVGLLTGLAAEAQPVIRYPGPEQNLDQQWQWALAQARSEDRGFWVGYSIDRLMGERSFTGRWNSDWRHRQSLHELIYGVEAPYSWRRDDESVQAAARRVLDDMDHPDRPNRKVWKEVGILFYFSRRSNTPAELLIGNLSMYADLDERPLYWLGKAEDEQSIPFLVNQYSDTRDTEVREDLVSAIGMHEKKEAVVPFLTEVLQSNAANDVREKATFWLGQTQDRGALRLLIRTANADRSGDVREKAVFAISQMEFDEATDALIDLAQRAERHEVRKKAVFWLGQKASKKAVAALRGFVEAGEDTEVQKQAVFALSQLPEDQSTPLLIDIAKTHRNPEVRKKAIFWLGQSDDPRALDALITFVRGQD